MSGELCRWVIGLVVAAVALAVGVSPASSTPMLPATEAGALPSAAASPPDVVVGGLPDRPVPGKAVLPLRGKGTRLGYRQVRHDDGSLTCENTRRLVPADAPACRVRAAAVSTSVDRGASAGEAAPDSGQQALAGCAVTLSAAVTDVVTFTVASDCGISTSRRISIYQKDAVGDDRVTTITQTPDTVVAVPQASGTGEFVAVVHDVVLPPAEWSAAGPGGNGWVAESSVVPTPAWSVELLDPVSAVTNYRWGSQVGDGFFGRSIVTLYDLAPPNPDFPAISWCGSNQASPGDPNLCDPPPPSGRTFACGQTVAMVNHLGPHEPPAFNDRFAVSPRLVCPKTEPSQLTDCPVCEAGDPINTASGVFTDSFVDVSAPGRGLGLGLVRSYTSARPNVEGWFGNGWSSNLETHLLLSEGTGATFVDSSGARDFFVLQPDGTTYEAASNVYGGLVKETTGGVVTYRLTDWRARMAWTFDDEGLLSSITDRNGESIALAWGATTVTVTLPKENAGRSMVLTFNGDPTAAGSNVTQVVDPMGRTNTYSYTSNNLTTATELYGIQSTYTYQTQANGNRMLTRTSGKGGGVTNTYDSQGRVTRQELKKSSSYTAVTIFDYGNGNQATPGGGTTTVTSQVGATANASLDPVTAYNYVNGQIESITTDSTQPAQAATTTFVRDPANLLPTKITDPMGQNTLFEYDALGNVTKTTAPPNNTTQTNPVTQARYDDWSQLTCAVDAVQYAAGVRCPAAGNPTPSGASGFVYDNDGNLTTSVDALGNTTTYVHGDGNHPGDVTSIQDAEGRVTGFSYDAYGNVAGTTATPSAGVTLTSQARYNGGSQLTCAVSPRHYADGVRCPAATATTFNTGANGFLYDTKGRVATKVNAKGATTTYGYDPDNNVVSADDPKGTTTDEYDLFGRITKHTVATLGTATAVTEMAYDIPATATGTCGLDKVPTAVQCSTSTDPANKVTTHYITSRGEYAGIKIPGNSVSKTTYRLDGQPDVVSLFGNRTLTYGYFPDGSLKNVSSSVAGTSTVSYTYRLDGLRNTMSDATGQTTYDYDDAGRVTSIDNFSSVEVGYSWDDTGLLKTLTYPSGRVVTRGYDGAGRFTSVNDGAPNGGNTTTFTLDEDGLIESVDYPNNNQLDVTLRDDSAGSAPKPSRTAAAPPSPGSPGAATSSPTSSTRPSLVPAPPATPTSTTRPADSSAPAAPPPTTTPTTPATTSPRSAAPPSPTTPTDPDASTRAVPGDKPAPSPTTPPGSPPTPSPPAAAPATPTTGTATTNSPPPPPSPPPAPLPPRATGTTVTTYGG